MTRYGHIAWRVIAVVALAGTAALAVTLTRVPAAPDHVALSSNLTGATAHSVLRVTGTGKEALRS